MNGIDLVVVNYHTPRDLLAFGRILFLHKPERPFRLFIYNVAPSPEDLRCGYRLSEEHDNVSHFWDKENIGYARACNWAAFGGGQRKANPYLAFFNADTRITDGVIDGCVSGLEAHEDWGAVGPRQYDEKNCLTHAGIFGTLDHPAHRGWRAPNDGRYQDVKEAVTVSGSAYFTRRSAWAEMTACELYRDVAPESVGAFLPTPHFFEETWYSYHLQAHGYKVMYLGTESMAHHWGKATDQKDVSRLMKTSQVLFRAACDNHAILHN